MPLNKPQLRQKYLALRQAIPSDEAQAAAQKVAKCFIDKVPLESSDIIAFYMPFRGELSPLILLEALAIQGHTTALPVINAPDAPLSFHTWRPQEPLMANRFFPVDEPEHGEKVVPTIVIVPLVAFNHDRHRLGYGKGMYDRTLAQLREDNSDVKSIGVAYACQECDLLEPAPHDQQLDMIITENA